MDNAEVAARAYTTWPLGTVPYVLGGADCSEFVCAVIGETRDLDTVTLVTNQVIRQLLPAVAPTAGNFLGHCGPGTGGANGHIAIIVQVDSTAFDVVEQRGGTIGPTEGRYPFDKLPADWAVYELVDQTPTPPITTEDKMHPWIAQDRAGIAVVWIDQKSGQVVWQNVGSAEAVAGWNAAGVPGPTMVPSIGQLGRNATS